MSKRTRSVQENMLFNTVGSLIYYICQWMMTVLIVKLSGFEDAGILTLAMSLTAAPAIVGLFNMRSYQVSDVKGQYSDCLYVRSRIFTNSLSVVICLSMILYQGYSMEKAIVSLVFMGFKVIEGFADVYYGIDQRKERLDYAGISMTVRGIGSLVLFVVALCVRKDLLLAIVLMSAWSLVVVLAYDRKKAQELSESLVAHEKVDKRQLLRLLWTCLPLAVVAFLNNLSLNIPKLYLEEQYGEAVMGIYNSIASPTIVIQLAATTLFAPLIPLLSTEYEKGDKKAFWKILKRFMVLTAVLVVACLGAVKGMEKTNILTMILTALFNPEIGSFVYLFFWVVVISIFIACNACMFSLCTLLREIRSQYLIGVAGVVSSFVFTRLFVKEQGMEGVVLALAGTLVIQILIQAGIILRKMRKQ